MKDSSAEKLSKFDVLDKNNVFYEFYFMFDS